MKLSDIDKNWLAGILEGEGSFLIHTTYSRARNMGMRGGISHHVYPRVYLGMTDYDIVFHAAELCKSKIQGPYQYGKKKPIWIMGLTGKKASCVMRQV